MIKKSASVGALVLALFAAQPDAHAKDLGRTYFGTGVAEHHSRQAPAHMTPAYHAPKYQVWSKRRVLRTLRHIGYYDFYGLRYSDNVFKVKAFSDGGHFQLHVSARNGRVIRRIRIY